MSFESLSSNAHTISTDWLCLGYFFWVELGNCEQLSDFFSFMAQPHAKTGKWRWLEARIQSSRFSDWYGTKFDVLTNAVRTAVTQLRHAAWSLVWITEASASYYHNFHHHLASIISPLQSPCSKSACRQAAWLNVCEAIALSARTVWIVSLWNRSPPPP